MSAGIIRTTARPSASPYARSIQPGLDIAPRPDAAPGAVRIVLGGAVAAMGIARPVQRQPMADRQVTQIHTSDHADRDRPTVLIEGHRCARHRPAGDKSVKIIGGLGAASMKVAVIVTAKLGAFGRVDTS